MKLTTSALTNGAHGRLIAILAILFIPSWADGQQQRIVGSVGSAGRVVLSGSRNPKAQPQFDTGRVDPEFKLSLVTLVFKPSPAQQASLTALLTEQQDRSSSNYHRWLTPEQYADRFGLNQEDIGKVKSWLQLNGLTVDYTARGRNWITLSGTARDIEIAFGTEIHWYKVDGETHFANATDPAIPGELSDVVIAVGGLDDFRLIPPGSVRRSFPAHPLYTGSNGAHALAPDDLATIYNISPLYARGITGSGQRIVVAGQSDINLSDIATFRQGLLPLNVPDVIFVPGSADPGMPQEDELEADLDLEWVGAVARNAQLIYVNSKNAVTSASYAISENLAPVVSLSFAGCEQNQSESGIASIELIATQANLQGITWLAASGDMGAAGCDSPMSTQAALGLGVGFPASLPGVTAIGGTEFDESTGNYWNSTNSGTLASAFSYIPEIAWNDTVSGMLSASGGGVSTLFSKPTWQAGPGVPNDHGRDVPDVAMAASPNHDPYIIVSGGQLLYGGGTSVATPVFAGIIALLNQYESNGQGNINPNLYRIPQTSAVHDIITGSNIVPCLLFTPNCSTGSFGYSAGIGYDPVTGLGSVDAYNLIANWNAPTPLSNVVLSCSPNPVYQQPANSQGYSWIFTLSLSETAGVATGITGLTIGGTDYSSLIATYFGTSTIPARGTLLATLGYKTLTVPTNIVFAFTGIDAGGRQWSQQVSVSFEASSTLSPLTIQTVPSGLQFSIDGGALLTAPQTLNLTTGRTHSISVASPQPGGAGTRYAFTSWSDGAAASHSFVLNGSATLTAAFQTQYQLTISASPTTGGTVTPTSGLFYNSGFTVPISATPNSGFLFSNWTGSVATASSANTTATMSGPLTVTANFTSTLSTGISYYFPQLAVGGGWQTTLTYVNYSQQSVTCQTVFYGDSGGALQVQFADSGSVTSRTDSLAPGATVHVQSTASTTGSLVEGWATGQCTGPVKASLLYRLYSGSVAQGEANVSASTAPATEFATFAEASTGIAWANPSSSPATLTVTALSSTGAKLSSTSFVLQPNQHGANNVGPLLGIGSFTGLVEITSTVPIVSLSLDAEVFPVFSSLPPGDLPAGTPLANGTGSGASSGSTFTNTYYFPQLAVGGGWQTTLTYVNYSQQSVTCRTAFYGDSGGALQVQFADSGSVTSRTDSLAPGATVHVQSTASTTGSLVEGWATGQCTGPVKASLLYRLYSGSVAQGEANVSASTAPATEFATFAEASTGIAWANPSSSPATLTVTALSSTGAKLSSTSFVLQPNQHGANNVGPLLGIGSFTGLVEITSTVPIVSLSLDAEVFPVFSSLPPGDLPAGTPLAN